VTALLLFKLYSIKEEDFFGSMVHAIPRYDTDRGFGNYIVQMVNWFSDGDSLVSRSVNHMDDLCRW
jgi:hypothetical protein